MNVIDLVVIFGVLVLVVNAAWWYSRSVRRAPLILSSEQILEKLQARPQTQVKPARCGGCKHFDKDEGQAILRLFPAFPRYDLPPCLVGAQYNEATGVLEPSSSVPAKCSWDDFGACTKHHELRWSEDQCNDFEAQP